MKLFKKLFGKKKAAEPAETPEMQVLDDGALDEVSGAGAFNAKFPRVPTQLIDGELREDLIEPQTNDQP